MVLIPALRKQRQHQKFKAIQVHSEFKVSLAYKKLSEKETERQKHTENKNETLTF